MPVSVERLENKPILIATVSDAVDVVAVREMFRQSAELIAEIDERVFRITDVSKADSNFAEVMGIIREASSTDMPGSTNDPRIQAVFVGNNQWVQMFRSAMALKQFGGKTLPMFLTIEDALEYIEIELGKKQES